MGIGLALDCHIMDRGWFSRINLHSKTDKLTWLKAGKRPAAVVAHKADNSFKVGILGASGYTGCELIRLIANHPHFEISLMTADRKAGQSFRSVYAHVMNQDLPDLVAIKDADFSSVDAVFCCLPHGNAQEIIKGLPTMLKIVDLSADFRLQNIKDYEDWYALPHKALELQKEAIYGLPEIYRKKIQNARLVANPGCYPTTILLPLVPLIKARLIELEHIVIVSNSGVSGAGRSPKEANLFTEVAEGVYSYGITGHRHLPEIKQELSVVADKSVTINFTPILVPMIRGMHSTINVQLASGVSVDDLKEHLEGFYAEEEFVTLLPGAEAPHTKYVQGSNFCHINVFPGDNRGSATIKSVIDNLVKGASGQALQNMNLMMGIAENTGLSVMPLFP